MNGRPRFAVRTKSEVLADGFLPVLAEGTVEKKVCKAFDFVTDHPGLPEVVMSAARVCNFVTRC